MQNSGIRKAILTLAFSVAAAFWVQAYSAPPSPTSGSSSTSATERNNTRSPSGVWGGTGTVSIPQIGGAVQFSCDFLSAGCGFGEHNALDDQPGRATIVRVPRSGSTAVRLHTEPGDTNVHGSGTWERDDLILGPSSSYCNQGQEEWWAHSVMFPDDFVYSFGVLVDFHDNATGDIQPNFSLMTTRDGLRLTVFGGRTFNAGRHDAYISDPYGAPTGNVTKNVWYDFTYHVKWSSGSDGLTEAWLNGKKIMSYRGANLYTGVSCYLKLANYHEPTGQPNSEIFDRVLRGTTAESVAIGPLEGVHF